MALTGTAASYRPEGGAGAGVDGAAEGTPGCKLDEGMLAIFKE